MTARLRTSILIAVAAATLTGCGKENAHAAATGEVVLYSSIDEPDLTPLLQQFEQRTGIHVRAVTDTEATKTRVLAERLEAEKDNPQADVYWGNEVFHTMRLAGQGVFAPYRPKTADDVPAKWRDAADLWTGVGVRARMIAFSTAPGCSGPTSNVHGLRDLMDPAWKGRIAMCHPAYGTASGHFAAMLVLWGEPKYREFLQAMHDNELKLLGGNAAVTDEIGAGHLWIGTADNDDVDEQKEEGHAVAGLMPDQGPDGSGTLLIPGAVALVHGARHPELARRLIDYLCSAEVERHLIDEHYLGWSVRGEVPVKAMAVDYAECAQVMRHAVELALQIVQGR